MSNEEEHPSEQSAADRSGEQADESNRLPGRYPDEDGADFDDALLDVSTVDATSETFLPEEQPEGNLIESDGYGRIARVTALGQSGQGGLSAASTASPENRATREATTLPNPAALTSVAGPEVE
ncbi:MAG: hypothetical protein KDK30_01415, partial [Leptospiraceae bacterium]|nr:hypothetical protein [Leptospiraceae bacterium]